MGAPSKLRLGGKAQTSTRHFQPTTENGCPIQASLGWDSTTLNPPLPTHHENGCPIQASLGWDSTTSTRHFQPTTKMGAPSKLRLGGIAQHPQPATSNSPLPTHHENGCPIQAPLGWDRKTLNPPLPTRHFQPTTKMGAPSKLRLGGIARTTSGRGLRS